MKRRQWRFSLLKENSNTFLKSRSESSHRKVKIKNKFDSNLAKKSMKPKVD